MPQMQAGDRKSARLQEDEMHMRVPVLLHLWGEVAWVPPRAHLFTSAREVCTRLSADDVTSRVTASHHMNHQVSSLLCPNTAVVGRPTEQ